MKKLIIKTNNLNPHFIGSWNLEPLTYESFLEIKVDHFRSCMRKFEDLIRRKY